MRLKSSMVLLFVLLGGCALSPQQVELVPSVTATTATQNVGHNLPIQVVGKDLRKSDVIGSRGSVYASTSLIRASNDVAGEMAALVRNDLQQRGFNALNAPTTAPQLAINLLALDYTPASGYVINHIVIDASIEARLTRADGSVFTRTYSSNVSFKQPVTPSASQNQVMLDDVLGRCVSQLLNDPLLLEKLQQTGADAGN